jgi:hypothetical protein
VFLAFVLAGETLRLKARLVARPSAAADPAHKQGGPA